MPPLLGIIAGMEAEAAALGQWREDSRIEVAISAGRPNRAAAETERLVERGASALLSWGIAGGLDPRFLPGDLLVADGVVEPGGRPFAFDEGLIAAIREAFQNIPGQSTGLHSRPERDPRRGNTPAVSVPRTKASAPPAELAQLANLCLLAGSEIVVCQPAAKAALHQRNAAAAVDMETHRVAAIARKAGLPAIAIRAISDPASRSLPALVAHALDEEGRPRIGAVLRGLAARPFDLPALIRAGHDSRKALGALSTAAALVIPVVLATLSDRNEAGTPAAGRDQPDI